MFYFYLVDNMTGAEDTLTCIVKMKDYDDYYRRWSSIRDVYQVQINGDLFDSKNQYTAHDYCNHCKNILTILNTIIPFQAYDKSLTSESLFCLNVSVILHDIAMFFAPENRMNHSEIAKKYIIEQVLLKRNSFLSQLLTHQEALFVSDIIYAHSDIKDDAGNIAFETLPSLIDKQLRSGRMGLVNTGMLAGLLRLADELDVTSWRVAGKNLIYSRIKEQSFIHWRQCELFGFPTKDERNATLLNLRIHEELINSTGDFDFDCSLIVKVENKIKQELTNVNTLVFDTGSLDGWTINKIEVLTDDKQLSENICKWRNKFNVNPLESGDPVILDMKVGDSISCEIINKEINVIDEQNVVSDKFSNRIENLVVNNNLLQDGHFFIDEKRFSRDWIDTNKILSNSVYLDEITSVFSSYIKSLDCDKSNLYVIGEGFPAIILASSLAFSNDLPLSYHIPHQYKDQHQISEKQIRISNNNIILLITDVIVTGKTITNTIDTICKDNDISWDNFLNVFTIFVRPPLFAEFNLSNKLIKKIVCLNKTLPIEICKKEKDMCLFHRYNIIRHKYEPMS